MRFHLSPFSQPASSYLMVVECTVFCHSRPVKDDMGAHAWRTLGPMGIHARLVFEPQWMVCLDPVAGYCWLACDPYHRFARRLTSRSAPPSWKIAGPEHRGSPRMWPSIMEAAD